MHTELRILAAIGMLTAILSIGPRSVWAALGWATVWILGPILLVTLFALVRERFKR